MITLETPALLWLLVIVVPIGLLSAWAARLSQGARYETSCQRFFLGCLILVGVATVASLGLEPGCWIISGATLSAMVLTVVCDFRGPSRAHIW